METYITNLAIMTCVMFLIVISLLAVVIDLAMQKQKPRRVTYRSYLDTKPKFTSPPICIHTPDFIADDSSLISAVAQREFYKKDAERWKSAYQDMDKANNKLHIEIERLNTFETFANNVSALPNCNDCGRKSCVFRPKCGDDVRFNCPIHRCASPSVDMRKVGIFFKKEN